MTAQGCTGLHFAHKPACAIPRQLLPMQAGAGSPSPQCQSLCLGVALAVPSPAAPEPGRQKDEASWVPGREQEHFQGS